MEVRIIVGIIAFFLVGLLLSATKRFAILGKILATLSIFALVAIPTLLAEVVLAISNVHSQFYGIVLLIFATLTVILLSCGVWRVLKKRCVWVPLVSALAMCIVTASGFGIYQAYVESIPTVEEREGLLQTYAPYEEDSKVVTLEEEATVRFEAEIPKMDGATALYPIYSAFAKAVYPKEIFNEEEGGYWNNPYLKCSTTTQAYEKIVTGEADIIFAAGPSKQQEQFAGENGVQLQYIPIGKEAFVFFVNARNPLNDVTIEQIQGIYSGNLTRWEQLGVKGFGEIRAFQRDEGSGSQSALQRLMEGKELTTPPKENVLKGMGGIISQTADYRNYKNAMGYSFRFYCSEMVKNDQIKLLSINGIYPDTASIENGSYPIASNFYAVIRSNANENTRRLVEWILSTQGQKIIEQTGYTPVCSRD